MESGQSHKGRLVKCPKCRKLLPEPSGILVYRCGGCDAVLQVKNRTNDADGEDEYAYQVVVKIGGHIFKGFLYDQGAHDDQTREGFPNISELHLGSASGGGGGGGGEGRNGACSSSPNILDPSDIYAASAGGFLGGSSYGNPIN